MLAYGSRTDYRVTAHQWGWLHHPADSSTSHFNFRHGSDFELRQCETRHPSCGWLGITKIQFEITVQGRQGHHPGTGRSPRCLHPLQASGWPKQSIGRQWEFSGRPDDGINPTRVCGDSGMQLGTLGTLRIDLIQIFEFPPNKSQNKKRIQINYYNKWNDNKAWNCWKSHQIKKNWFYNNCKNYNKRSFLDLSTCKK